MQSQELGFLECYVEFFIDYLFYANGRAFYFLVVNIPRSLEPKPLSFNTFVGYITLCLSDI